MNKVRFKCPQCGMRFAEYKELAIVAQCPRCLYLLCKRDRDWIINLLGLAALLAAIGLGWFFVFGAK